MGLADAVGSTGLDDAVSSRGLEDLVCSLGRGPSGFGRLFHVERTTRCCGISFAIQQPAGLYIGGKARNMNRQQRARKLAGRGHKNAWAGKVAVMGLLQRHPVKGKSRVRTVTVDSVRTYRLNQEVSKQVEDGSTVYTDALAS
jgi:transposase-like protein